MTASAIVEAGRSSEDTETAEHLVRLVDEHGLDTVAALWAGSPARSLPGVLWRLYVLREWVSRDPVGAAAEYDSGMHVAQVPRVVAGAAEPPTAEGLVMLLDAILGGVFTGDLAVALDRAGAFCRVVSAGRVDRSEDDASARRAAALIDTAEDLEAAALLWRSGELV